MCWYVASNHGCLNSGCFSVSFSWSQFSCSVADGRISFVVHQCVSVCLSSSAQVCQSMCVCKKKKVYSFFPSSTLTSLNSWLSLSSHSRGRLFSQLLVAIQCGSITDVAINTRGHGVRSITNIIEKDSTVLGWIYKRLNLKMARGNFYTVVNAAIRGNELLCSLCGTLQYESQTQ